MKLLSACCILLGISQPIYATPPTSDNALKLPNIVVDGKRPVEDAAAPSTVILPAKVTDSVADLPQILDQQPGLRTSSMGGLNRFSMLSIRGSTTEQVLVYLDGIPLNSAEGGPVDLSAIPLGPLERVTIYRGVSPILFGSSSIGGVVDIQTREINGSELELQVGGGSFYTRQTRGFYGTGGKSWALGLSMDYLGTQGNFDFTNDRGTLFDKTDDQQVERGNNHSDQITGMLKGHLQLSNHLTIRFINLTTWRHLGVPGTGLHPLDKANVSALRTLTGIRLVAKDFGIPRARLSLVPFVSYSASTLRDPASEIVFTASESTSSSLVPGASFLLKAPLALDASWRYILATSLAAEYRYERFEQEIQGGAFSGLPSDRHRVSGAVECQFLMEPLSTELVGSVRYEADWSELTDSVADPGTSRSKTVSAENRKLSWRSALVYSAPFNVQLKLNAAANFRPPSLFELFGNTGAVQGNAALAPERSLGADIGLVWSSPQTANRNSASVQLFAFWNRVDDLIQFVQNAQQVAVAQNVAKAHLVGAELGAYTDLFNHLRLRANVTWLQAENHTDLPARYGKRLPHRPEWKAFNRLEGYWRNLGVLSELGLHLSLDYAAENFLDHANLVKVPHRMLLGAGIHAWFNQRQWLLDFSARNLTNIQVQDFAGYPLPGLTLMASLKWAPSTAAPSQQD